MSSRQQSEYYFEKKLSVVDFYLSNEVSYQELAIQEGITNPSNRYAHIGINILEETSVDIFELVQADVFKLNVKQ